MTSTIKHHYQSGQALTSLLIIMFIGMSIISAASALVSINSSSTTRLQMANQALSVAESGIEDSLLRILRNPSFTGQTLTVADGTATVTVASGNPTIITSRGTAGPYQRTLRVAISFNSGVMSITSWKEVNNE